ncbi:MAG: VanZ family protein [Acidobacteria bacterium]|nr:VanZ family protein [Acidobacteriota bacterium]
MSRRISLWAPVVVYMAAIFYLSSMPQPPLPPGGDKPWHSTGYFGLAVVVTRAVAGGLPRRITLAVAAAAVAIAAGYGATDEFHQMFVPGRSADFNDLVADVVGVCTGTGACWAWGIISPSRDEL